MAQPSEQDTTSNKQRTVSLSNILLVFLLCVVLIIGLLPFCALLGSGTKQSLEQNSVDIADGIVQNRHAALQNAMVDQWGGIRSEADYLNAAFNATLQRNGISAEAFAGDNDAKAEYAAEAYSELLEYLRRDSSTGVFLVLANSGSTDAAQDYTGFFLRDSDPDSKTETNSDLLVERGMKGLSQDSGISLDSSWKPKFSFAGSGQRSCDDFFYKPFEAALSHPGADITALGYWSAPFVLENSTTDNHRMITYSIPLVQNGVVYGVMGVEISVNYLLNTYFSVSELDKSDNAGFVLAVANADGSYTPLVGKGALFDAATSMGTQPFELDETEYADLYSVRDASVGRQGVFACTAPLTLYSSKVPYDNTNWVLVGLVPQDYVYAMGSNLYNGIAVVIVVCVLAGMVLVAFASRGIARPVRRLIHAISDGIEGLRAYHPTRVREIDELHTVVLGLTEEELEAEERLREEKERYRLAVESSSDVFFSYRMAADGSGTFEVVNSARFSGVWPAQRFIDEVIGAHMSPGDQKLFLDMLYSGQDNMMLEVLFVDEDSPEGRWLEVHAKPVSDSPSGLRFIVGYLRNIDEAKRRDLAARKKSELDPVTGFYRRGRGLELMRTARAARPAGVMILIDLEHFNGIVRRYGMTFGDVVLEELARHIMQVPGASAEDLIVRAGSDEVLIWAKDVEPQTVHARLDELSLQFGSVIRHGSVRLGFNAGVALGEAGVSTDELIRRVQVCVVEARDADRMVMDWADVVHPERTTRPFGKIESMGYISQLGLSSLALNLLDRRFSVAAALDLLVGKLRERFTLDNLIIASFDEDYLASTIRYSWKALEGVDEKTCVVHMTLADCEALQERAGSYALRPLSRAHEILPHILLGEQPCGFAFAMVENGKYSGSIFLIGLPDSVLDVEEDKKTLREICSIIQNRLAQEHLDQSAQAKSDFLARMSHEIRTPMNGIIGMTDIALQEGQSPERVRDCLEKVSTSSRYLLGLLNDILDMSKIESGKMELVEKPFDLRATIEALHPVLDARFQESEQRFVVDANLAHTCVVGDELRLSQVLINLLGNANKYSPADTDVALRVRELSCEGGFVRVSFAVIDHGVGVDETDRKRIFGKFEQVENIPSRRQGTGLGLSISNHFVCLMGSTIELQSEVGVGSTFSFELSLSVAAQEAAAESENDSVRDDYSGMRVLVAEDNALNREIITCMLQDLGFTVLVAEDGLQAVAKFEQSSPEYFDLIIMDVMMPRMGGLEATHRIRGLARPDAHVVPIIAASANAFDEDVNRSLAAGMNAHMSKPVDAHVLKETLANVLA